MRITMEPTGLIYGLLARDGPGTVPDLLSGSELKMISFLRLAPIESITPRSWRVGRAGEKQMAVHLLYFISDRTTFGT